MAAERVPPDRAVSPEERAAAVERLMIAVETAPDDIPFTEVTVNLGDVRDVLALAGALEQAERERDEALKLAEDSWRIAWAKAQRDWQTKVDRTRALEARAEAAEAQLADARRTLGRIKENAEAWHGVVPVGSELGAGHARALAVIASWVDAALASESPAPEETP